MAEAQRVEIGFEGGQVISARLGGDDLKDLRKQVEKGGWHDVRTEDGVLSVYLGKVAFLRIDSGDHRVGFLGETMDSGVCHIAPFSDPDGNALLLHNRYAPRS